MEHNIPTPAEFIEKGNRRYSAKFLLGYEDFAAFNRFLFLESDELKGSKKRIRWVGNFAMLAAAVLAVVLLVTKNADPTLIFCACALLIGGALALCYYPLIFPRQFEASIGKSYRESGYADQELELEFYEDGILDRSYNPPAAALWEDVKGFYETESLFLFQMDQHQAVVLPKKELPDPAAFAEFAETMMRKSDSYNKA